MVGYMVPAKLGSTLETQESRGLEASTHLITLRVLLLSSSGWLP